MKSIIHYLSHMLLLLRSGRKVVVACATFLFFSPLISHAFDPTGGLIIGGALLLGSTLAWFLTGSGGPVFDLLAWVANGLGKVAVDIVVAFVSWLLVLVIDVLLFWSTALLEVAIDPGIGRVTDFPLVQAVVPVTRDLSNLFLVGILVIIAFATILGIESWGVRRLLPTLIGIVLIVNFSTVIAGMVIDAGQTGMNYFANAFKEAMPKKSDGTPQSLGDYLSFQLNLSRELTLGRDNIKELTRDSSKRFGESGALMESLLNAVAMAIVIGVALLAAYIFFRLALLLLMRYVVFWLLLIVAPLAFFAGVLPATKQYFRTWWHQLLNWSFLGFVTLFIVYLGTMFWGMLNTPEVIRETFAVFQTSKLSGRMSLLFTFPLVAFFFLYALRVAKSMAGAAANAIVDSVISIGKGIALGGLALAGSAALAGVGGAALRQGFARTAGERLQRSGNSYLRRTGSRLLAEHEKAIKGTQDDIRIAEKGFEGIVEQHRENPTALLANYNRLSDPRQKLGYIRAMNAAGAPLDPLMIGDVQNYAPTLDRELLKTTKEIYPQIDKGIYVDEDPTKGFNQKALHKKFDEAKQPHKINLNGFTDSDRRNEAFMILATTLNRGDLARIARDPIAFERFREHITDIEAGLSPAQRNALFDHVAAQLGFTRQYIDQTYAFMTNWRDNAASERARAPRPGGGGPGPTPPTP